MPDAEEVGERTFAQNWNLIQSSLDHLAQGISVFNRELDLVLFNNRFVQLLGFPPGLVHIGTSFAELIGYNARRGEYGEGDIEALVAERVARAGAFTPHVMERERPDGTIIEIRGNPLPGGGFVTIYTDITERKRVERRLEELATTDELTRTSNRRHFFFMAEQEVARARRTGNPAALLMIDADNFKKVNDSWGHTVGDEVLRELVRRCRDNIRTVDTLARYGGEEFACLLPETTAEGAMAAAERIRLAMARAPVTTPQGAVPCTVSIGVATMAAGDGDLADLIERADAALYRAKHYGRNRVAMGDPVSTFAPPNPAQQDAWQA